jgi:hypothetical protein
MACHSPLSWNASTNGISNRAHSVASDDFTRTDEWWPWLLRRLTRRCRLLNSRLPLPITKMYVYCQLQVNAEPSKILYYVDTYGSRDANSYLTQRTVI